MRRAERLVVLQGGIDRYVLGEGEEGVAVVVVVEGAARPPEQLSLLEEVPFVLGDGDAGAVAPEPGSAPALVAVVVRVQHPLDALDPGRAQVVEDGSRA